MTREMSLIVVLMSASIAAAMAAPDIALPVPPAGCPVVQAAGEGKQDTWPVAASVPAAAHQLAACEPDAGAIYRQWHHGSARLQPGCNGTAAELGKFAELQ